MHGSIQNIGSKIELERMSAVKRYDILDSPPDGAFDHITSLAARKFNVPIAIISIIDHDRIWFKSHHGLPISEIPRDEGLCATTILSAFPRILTDAKNDTCALINPLVAGDFGLRFYAGVPLRTYDGHNLGTLCVVDTTPRPVTQAEVDDLSDLAAIVMDQLELRISARNAIAREKLLAKEIDHRVMNSLQFISSMLTMQSMVSQVPEAKSELQMAANRVNAVAQVHRNFYTHASAEVCCLTFLRRLCKDMAGILNKPINVSGQTGLVPTTMLQPIGLIVSELITNAAKHGNGKTEVVFYLTDGGGATLRVCNEGDALPDGFDPAKTKGLGMRVINSLVQQLRGQMEIGRHDGDGACFTVTFPV